MITESKRKIRNRTKKYQRQLTNATNAKIAALNEHENIYVHTP
jgi:hypothetical protein